MMFHALLICRGHNSGNKPSLLSAELVRLTLRDRYGCLGRLRFGCVWLQSSMAQSSSVCKLQLQMQASTEGHRAIRLLR
jgi:hypothetical protein